MKPEMKKPTQVMNILTVVLVLILLSLFLVGFSLYKKDEIKDTSALITALRAGEVRSLTLSESKDKFTAEIYKKNDKSCSTDKDDLTIVKYQAGSLTQGIEYVPNILKTQVGEGLVFGTEKCNVLYKEDSKSFVSTLLESGALSTILLFGVVGLVAFLLLKKLGDTNSKSMSFGNSKAKEFVSDDKNKTSFADVAGNDEAKEELNQVVDFLKRPKDYLDMGAKIPKGVLLVGGPGNGKTLLAKSVAGEAGVPFFFVSGSEFVEMFVGVGASRVRDMFKQAKKKAPCVIFIDEIDAVGRKRGNGVGNSNDEREQTLNQILVEMDGFEKNESIIVLAATNRPDVLDSALLRPGRFDRQVTVTAPDRKERELILKVHSKNKKLSSDVDLSIIAKRTSGFSGADLANLLNEASILSVSLKRKSIDNDILREAIEKTMLGPALKSKIQTQDQRELTAIHEAGHAILASVIPDANKVQKITITPRGRAGGYTFNTPDEDSNIVRKSKLLAEITVLLGGYASEKFFYGEMSTGASNDLEKASEIARSMVTKYGMSNMGPVSFHSISSMSYTHMDNSEKSNYSELTAQYIDKEITSILQSCLLSAENIVKENKDKIKLISNKLLENDTLEYEEFNLLMGDSLQLKVSLRADLT